MVKISVSEENYIKAIYKLQQQQKTVTTNALAAELDMRPASVTDMAQKLKARHFIQYKKYYGITLTAAGEKTALFIIRKHRLWESFLVEKLGFSWEEVHEVAEELEHIHSEKLIEKLAAFLNHPVVDPHGDPIPDAQGKIHKSSLHTLQNCPLQKKLEVSAVADQSRQLLHYLNEKNIRLGTALEVIQRNEFDNSVEIKIRNLAPFTLSDQVAKNILVVNKSKM